MANAAEFGKRLKYLRKQAGMTQAAAADAIGMARSTLAAIETGHDMPGREAMVALARFYRVSLDHLETGSSSLGAQLPDDAPQSPEEAAVVTLWRLLDESQRRAALAAIRAIVRAPTTSRPPDHAIPPPSRVNEQ